MTITQLADLVGMTPRNIRAYQSRGLLAPPQIQDRLARYTGSHAARLELIAWLQREGFTLAAIKGLIDRPASYADIVADRRRQVQDGSSDIPLAVPVSADNIERIRPGVTAELVSAGILSQDDDQLMIHSLLAGVGRTLVDRGIALEPFVDVAIEVSRTSIATGKALRAALTLDDQGEPMETQRRDDLALIAVQLLAAIFEISITRHAVDRAGQPAGLGPAQP